MKLILTFGSVSFLILLSIVFYYKMKYISTKRNIFLYLVITCLLVAISEIIELAVFTYINNSLWQEIILKIHWMLILINLWVYYLYAVCYANAVEGHSFKKTILTSLNSKLVSSLDIILIIISLFLPVGNLNNYFFPKVICIYTFVITCLNMFFVILGITLKKYNLKKSSIYYSFIVSIILVISATIFQSLVKNYLFFTTVETIICYIFYFVIENPDLEVVNELEQVTNKIENSNQARSKALHSIPSKLLPVLDDININCNNINENNNKNDIDKYLKNIMISSKNILDEINNVVDFSLLRANKIVAKSVPYNLKDLINKLNNFVSFKKNELVKITFDINENLPSILQGDAVILYNALSNILANAIKNTKVGKIKLSILGERNENGVLLKISIIDTGEGLSEEIINYINFKDNSIFDNDCGLGIYIIKRNIELLGGSLYVESEHEVGSNFKIELQQEVVQDDLLGKLEYSNENKKIDYTNFNLKNVLIASDKEMDIVILTKLFKRYNLNVDIVNDFRGLMSKIKTEEKYSIIFVDEFISDYSSDRVIKKIRMLDGYNLPPIILMIYSEMVEHNYITNQNGYDGEISFPINEEEFDKILKKNLNK